MKDKELEKRKKEMEEFEAGFPEGVYTDSVASDEPRVNVRLLSEYCRKKGVRLKDLTNEEREQFLIYPNEK